MAGKRSREGIYALIGLLGVAAAMGAGLLWLGNATRNQSVPLLEPGVVRTPALAFFAVPAVTGSLGSQQESVISFDSQGAPIQSATAVILMPALAADASIAANDPSCAASLSVSREGNKLTASCSVRQTNQLVAPFTVRYRLGAAGSARITITEASSVLVGGVSRPVFPAEQVVTARP